MTALTDTTVSENLRRILTPDQSGTNPQYNAIVHSDQLSRLLLTPSLHYDSEENLFEGEAIQRRFYSGGDLSKPNQIGRWG